MKKNVVLDKAICHTDKRPCFSLSMIAIGLGLSLMGDVAYAAEIKTKVSCSSSSNSCTPVLADGDSVTISGTSSSDSALKVSSGDFTFSDLVLTNTGKGYALYSSGGSLTLNNATLTSEQGVGVYIQGGSSQQLNINNSIINSNYLSGVKVSNGNVTLTDTTINTLFNDDNSNISYNDAGLYLNLDANSSAKLVNVDINVTAQAIGSGADEDDDLSLGSGNYNGIDIWGTKGKLALDATNTHITVTDNYGYYWVGNSGYGTFTAIGLNLHEGNTQYHGGSISVDGDASIGIWVNPWLGDGRNKGLSTLSIDGETKITATGYNAKGIYQTDGNSVYIGADTNSTHTDKGGANISVEGQNSTAFGSASTDMTNVIYIADSILSANADASQSYTGGTGMLLAGGAFDISLYNTTITADTALYVKDYYLCNYANVAQNFYTDTVSAEITHNSVLNGNIRVDDLDNTSKNYPDNRSESTTVVNLNFTDNSALNGSVNAYDPNTKSVMANSSTDINLSFDNTSSWTVTGTSEVDSLNSSGNIIFADNNVGNAFSTLTTHSYQGGGNMTFNADISSANHGSNMLILDGVNATPQQTTYVTVNGKGADSSDIDFSAMKIVDAQNGATTDVDDFTFNPNAKNYNHDGTDTVAIGAHNYNLTRTDSGSDESDWYINYTWSDIEPAPTPDPIPDPDPVPDPDPTPNPTPENDNYRSDIGAYLGNQIVAQSMFNMTLHDRRSYNAVNGQGISSNNTNEQDPALWMRIKTNSGKNYTAVDHNVDMDIDSTTFQMGGDVINRSLLQGSLIAGVMGGYGHAETNASAMTNGMKVDSDGKVDGYNLGLYGTWYANQEAKTGLYIDSWMQYSWFDNEVNGALSSNDSYSSSNWAMSAELGYAWQPLNYIMIEPQAQVIFNQYDANDHYDGGGTRIHSEDSGTVTSRLGLRISGTEKIQPYAEVNWWHHDGNNTISMNQDRVSADNINNIYEVKTGVSAELANNFHLWGELSTQQSHTDFESYGGSVGVKYRF